MLKSIYFGTSSSFLKVCPVKECCKVSNNPMEQSMESKPGVVKVPKKVPKLHPWSLKQHGAWHCHEAAKLFLLYERDVASILAFFD